MDRGGGGKSRSVFAAALRASIVRPETTLPGAAAVTSYSSSGLAAVSRSLINSQSDGSFGSRFSIQPPDSFSPTSRNLSSPLANAAAGSSRETNVPRSQTITSPAPYSPSGMRPSKVA
jgi:hypothetical protein